MTAEGSLAEDLASAARFGGEGTAVTRFAWSPELMQAHRWLAQRLEAPWASQGSSTRQATSSGAGRPAAGRAVLVGSHLDTVPRGGRYDGALGVLAGLDAIRRLKARGAAPARPVWLVSFMDEEGARFGTALLGSRAFAGEDLADVAERRDADGTTLRDAMAQAGFAFDRLGDARAIDDVGAYIELHIEQGTVLESAGADIGIVTGLAGILGMRVTFRGRADHAGTTPMHERRDALVGAARAIVALRDHAARRSWAAAHDRRHHRRRARRLQHRARDAARSRSTRGRPGARTTSAPASGSTRSCAASRARRDSRSRRAGRTGNRPMTSTSA